MRFCKEKVRKILEINIRTLENEHGFYSGNGWNQVNGKGEEINRAYGKWDFARILMDVLELD